MDDLSDYRPGIKALREHGVRSPMVELGLDKAEIRRIAEEQACHPFACKLYGPGSLPAKRMD